MLDKDILAQLSGIFKMLDSPAELRVRTSATDKAKGKEMIEFIDGVCSASPLLSYSVEESEKPETEFTIFHAGKPTRITFRGIPGGHEFNSLLLAILNANGKGKNLPDPATEERIKAIKGPVALRTFVSLSCTNCPNVVQALNIIALINPSITHTVIDGGAYPAQAEQEGVQAVPTVFANRELFSVGRASLGELIEKLETTFGYEVTTGKLGGEPHNFDMLMLGGGPAGVAAAIYGARKGLNIGIIAKEAGGSVSLTGDIDNLITARHTTGTQLANELKDNAAHYGVQIFDNRTCSEVNIGGEEKTIITTSGEVFTCKALIIATGTTPSHLNVPGEIEYTGRGVAFCPHCDGPYFKGKDVVVVGGGNAGIEAAIDLAALCRKVTVLEFLPGLKADQVLLDRMASLPNVEAHINSQVVEIHGNGKAVTSISIKKRDTNEDYTLPIDGVFIQIGTIPNSDIFKGLLELNKAGEIVTDRKCRTSVKGVYAAGDVASSPFKQIVVALGEGATAALTAFEDMMRS